MLPGKAATKLLEGAQAPIGTFSTRLDMAAVLGLVTTREYQVCQLIRRIRNECAHLSDTALSYATPQITALCKQLEAFFVPEGTLFKSQLDRSSPIKCYL